MDTEKDLSSLISSVMQSPQFADILSSLTSSAEKPNNEGTKKEDITEENTAKGNDGIPLSPELASTISQLAPALSAMGVGKKESPPQKSGGKNRKALLYALKPYLSEKRCAVIDGLLQFEGLAGVLDTMNRLK